MDKDRIFNTSDIPRYNFKETDPEFYNMMKERTLKAFKVFFEQDLEVIDKGNIVEIKPKQNSKNNTDEQW